MFGHGVDVRTKAHVLIGRTVEDGLVDTIESAAADEQDVRRVDLKHFLMRMLAAALRRNTGNGPFEDLQKGLLNAFTGNVASNGRVFRFTGNLIDFVDVDDAPFSFGNIVISSLDELEQAVFDVFADIAGFGQARRIGDGKGHIEEASQGLGQERLAAPCRADHDDIRFLQFHIIAGDAVRLEALIMVINGDGQGLLSRFLTNDVIIKDGLDFMWRRQFLQFEVLRRFFLLFVHDVLGDGYAFVADIHTGTGNQLADFALGPAAKAAARFIFPIHCTFLLSCLLFSRFVGTGEDFIDEAVGLGFFSRHEIIPFRILLDDIQRLSCMLRQDAVQFLAHAQDFTGVDFDFRRLTLDTAERLVDHDLRVRKGETLAFGTSCQEDRGHAGSDDTAGAIDIQVDILVGIFRFKEQELCSDDVGHRVIDGAAEEDDAVFQ